MCLTPAAALLYLLSYYLIQFWPEMGKAVLGGIVGLILAALLGLFSSTASGLREDLSFIFTKTRRNVRGKWKGDGKDLELPGVLEYKTSFTYDADVELKQRGSLVKGKMTATADNGRTLQFSLKGKLLYDHYIYMEYKLKQGNSVHFGAWLCFFAPGGDALNGYYLARSVVEGRDIVFGQVRLKKVQVK